MVQTILSQDITLEQLTEIFGLTSTHDNAFFPEWLDNLPPITDFEKQ